MKYPNQIIKIIFGCSCICFFGTSIYVIAYFPNRYSILENYISNLGGLINSTKSAQLWNTIVIITGIGLFMVLLLLPIKFRITRRFYINLLRIIGLCAGIGFSMVGIFPEYLGIWHMIPAFISLIGLLVYHHLLFILTDKYLPNRRILSIFLIITDFLTLGLIFFQFILNNITLPSSFAFLLTVPPWEWGIFLVLWIILGFFAFNSPVAKEKA